MVLFLLYIYYDRSYDVQLCQINCWFDQCTIYLKIEILKCKDEMAYK